MADGKNKAYHDYLNGLPTADEAAAIIDLPTCP